MNKWIKALSSSSHGLDLLCNLLNFQSKQATQLLNEDSF